MMEKLGILLVVAALFLEMISATSLGVVYTEGGMVEGTNIHLGFQCYMDIFKGIPFADIPGRFEKPKRHPGWDGILRANKFKERCLQLKPSMTSTHGTEDCLYLNIWVPHGFSVSTDLPVMVWIYGGGFQIGSSTGPDNMYTGGEIAERGKVIVVTLGYRVGTLGFLSSGDSSLPGNYGLWDQRAAIAWVHRNIRSFGGDPDNITIFGGGAGGACVSLQTLTPHNKGLFKRAISQSGVALSPWSVNRNPHKLSEEVALMVNCTTDHSMAACLRRADPVALTLASKLRLTSGSVVNNLVLSPVIDGDFLPDEPYNLFHNAADIDYIAGVNNMDAYVFARFDVPSIDDPLVDTPLEDMIWLLASYIKEKGKAGLVDAFTIYTSTWGSNPSKETIKKTIVEIATDYTFLVPAQVALYLHAANAINGRTYSYLFSEPSSSSDISANYPAWLGADHIHELQYVFGKPVTMDLGYLSHQDDITNYMVSYWTNFAKTGDPNKGELSVPVSWPRFTTTGHQFLEIKSQMDTNSVRQKMRKSYVHFWTSILYPIEPKMSQR